MNLRMIKLILLIGFLSLFWNNSESQAQFHHVPGGFGVGFHGVGLGGGLNGFPSAVPFRGYSSPYPFLTASETGGLGQFSNFPQVGAANLGISPFSLGAFYGGYGGGFGYPFYGYGGFGYGGFGYGGYGYGYGGYNYNYNPQINIVNIYNGYGSGSGFNSFMPQPANTLPPSNRAKLTLNVPENSEVWLNGKKIDSKNRKIVFESPKLESGKSAVFDFKVIWLEGDKKIEEAKKIELKANESRTFTYLAIPQS